MRSEGRLQRHFSAPEVPDFNLLDAFLFPSLERACNERGAMTHDEIREVAASVWDQVTPDECAKAVRRVQANMKASIDLKGRNFYSEGHT